MSGRAGRRLWETETLLKGLAHELTHSKPQHQVADDSSFESSYLYPTVDPVAIARQLELQNYNTFPWVKVNCE